jgi:ankyrin repeat protein
MKSKIGVLIFSGLFMLGFGGFGIFVGANQLWQHASGALRAMRMVSVEATVDVATLNESRASKGGTVYRVDTKYRYKYDREEFVSSRVGFGSLNMSDSNLGFHRGWVQRLEQAQSSGKKIEAWVDPSEPTYAVLDKTIRWTTVFFMLPFAILFPAIGIGAGYVFVKTLFTPALKFKKAKNAKQTPLNPPQLTPRKKGLAYILGSIALAVFSSPFVATGFFTKEAPSAFAIISAMLCCGVVALFVAGVRALMGQRVSSRPSLSLIPAQPRPGDRVRVRVTLPTAADISVVSIVFTCNELDTRSAGSSTTWLRSSLNLVAARVATSSSESSPQTTFEGFLNIPASSQPSQETPGGRTYRWSAEIEESEGVYPAEFDFSLFPQAGENLAQADAPFGEAERAIGEPLLMPVPKRVATISKHGKALTVTFTAPGLHAGPIVLLLLAVGCIGWVAKSLFTNLVPPFEVGFLYAPIAVVGILCVEFATHFATRVTRTTISPNGITRTRESVLKATHWMLPLAHIGSIELAERNQHTQVWQPVAVVRQTVGGEPQPLSPIFAQLGVANAVVSHMIKALAAVKDYGITSPPSANVPHMYSATQRIFARTFLLILTTVVIGGLFLYTSGRGPALIAATADQLNTPQTRAQRKAADRANFTPADPKRFDAMMTALDDKNVSAMEALLNDGADANTTRWDGYTLLIRAAYNNDAPMVNLLLKHRADPNLAMAAPHERAGVTALSDALYRKNISMANALIEAGARTDNATCCGWTLAHVAAESDSVEVLEFVAARDVRLNDFAKGSRGETPLMVAARYGGLKAIRWLHEKGVDKNVRDPYGYNAVGWAVFFKQSAAQQLLVELGADADSGAKAKQ